MDDMAAEKTELRGIADTNLVSFLDACALARKMDRNSLVNKILRQWAEQEAHRSNVLQRAARGNPLLSESPASVTDWGELS
jgi:hypothetical protein